MTSRFLSTLVVGLAVLFGGGAGVGAVAAPTPSGPVSTYVVTLRPVDSTASATSSLLDAVDGEVTATYSHVLQGFAARMPAAAAALLRLDPRVASVTPDRIVRTTSSQHNPPWGLDRSDERRLPLDKRYTYPKKAGAGAHVYVLDTGLNAAHSELAGRVGAGANFVPFLIFPPDPLDWGDCNGHGTHVASTAVGTRFGVAKRATVHGVRVLDCDGSGPVSQVLEGMDWVAANHRSPAVVNLSLSADTGAPELEAAARGLVQAGVSVVVAAGNADVDACLGSPAAEPAVLTVGATTETDARASFSNFGPCVDLFAPGSSVEGADYLDASGSVVMSGTSMASPHVAGAVAIVRSRDPKLSAAKAQAKVLGAATTGAVGSGGAGSPNRLLFVTGGDAPPTARFTVRCKGLRCTLSARRSSDDRGIKRYHWHAGRIERSGRSVDVHFGSAGNKRIELKVVDTAGQRAIRVKRVEVRRG